MHLETERCSFLEATVDFQEEKKPVGQENYLLPGQTYTISLDLELPTDETNRKTGMFVTCLKLEAANGRILNKDDTCRSAILPHRTSVSRGLRSLNPFSNSGGEESLSIEFLDNFKDDAFAPVTKAHLEIQSRYIGISRAYLRLHAHFDGFRYLMYHYPISSGIFGITFISIFLVSMLFLVIGKMLDPVVVSNFEKTSNAGSAAPKRSTCEIPSRLEKCPNFGKIVEKIEKLKDDSKTNSDENSTFRQRSFNSHED